MTVKMSLNERISKDFRNISRNKWQRTRHSTWRLYVHIAKHTYSTSINGRNRPITAGVIGWLS